MGVPHSPPDPSSSNSDSDSLSGSGSGAGSLAGSGALAGAGALAGSGALSGAGSYSGSDSDNANGNLNANGNFDANGNLNGNLNSNINDTMVTVCDKVDVAVSADLGPPTITDAYDTGSFNTTSTTYNVTANLTDSPITIGDANNFLAGSGDSFTFTAGGTETAFHIDQVNSLISNNQLSDVSLTNDSTFSQYATDLTGGTASTGAGIDHSVSDTATATVSATAAATATLSAFTQNIVLGANIQFNSLTQTVTGGSVNHTTSVADPGHDIHGGH